MLCVRCLRRYEKGTDFCSMCNNWMLVTVPHDKSARETRLWIDKCRSMIKASKDEQCEWAF